jgi:hypothetical protein
MLMRALIEPFVNTCIGIDHRIHKQMRYLLAFFYDAIPQIFSAWAKVFDGKAHYFLDGLLGPALVYHYEVETIKESALNAFNRLNNARNCIRTSNGSMCRFLIGLPQRVQVSRKIFPRSDFQVCP